jgi:hypothetical protein
MATRMDLIGSVAQERSTALIGTSLRFDILMSLLSAWLIGGLFLDGWAHVHIPELETFFTPWHGVLYSGYFAIASVIVGTAIINRTRGATWREIVPQGYHLTLIAAPVFMVGGVLDMIGHIMFGIETGVEPLLSPSHLLLAFSGVLLITGALRAAWQRADGFRATWRTHFPMLLSLTLAYSVLAFFSQFAHPVATTWLTTNANPNNQWLWHGLGVAGVLVQSTLTAGMLLMLTRRWKLPFGAVTFVLSLSTAGMGYMFDTLYLVPAAVITGLIADVMLIRIESHSKHGMLLRSLAGIVPGTFTLLYMATIAVVEGLAWSNYLWTGAVVMAGVAGYLLSLVVIPPQMPTQSQAHN